MRYVVTALCVWVLATSQPAHAQSAPPAAAPPSAAGTPAKAEVSLPSEHVPTLQMRVEPAQGVRTGELVNITLTADALLGDDVTLPDQSFSPFEVHKKNARVEPPQGGKQRFVFDLGLIALEPGAQPIPAIEARVVTKDGTVGSVKTEPRPYQVRSWLANEPNAQPRSETKPVSVEQDNYVPLYLGGGLLAVAAIAGLTLLVSRYLRNRKKAEAPPPPPRPPWDIAVEKLGELRKRKQRMIEQGQGALLVDQVSDIVREYLGGRFGFVGLESTTDETLMLLSKHGAGLGFTQDVGQFLRRCDLVKFAKVEPDQDEADLIFSKAQDLVHFSEPQRAQPSPTAEGSS
jgi:hypothetical protein